MISIISIIIIPTVSIIMISIIITCRSNFIPHPVTVY